MNIVLDFDGTVVTHDYPKIGKDIGAQPVLKALVDNGHKLILFTMRSDKELIESVQWFEANEIELYGIQKNPTQDKWTTSPKAYGELIIDDAALGCPLLYRKGTSLREFADWRKINELLYLRELYNHYWYLNCKKDLLKIYNNLPLE